MSLLYKFAKERLLDGQFVLRPKIFVVLHGDNGSIEVPALIDSGADVTVIPEGIALAIGLDMEGKKKRLFGYMESSDAIESDATIDFVGKAHRESTKLKVPVLISQFEQAAHRDDDIVLGVAGVFDAFDILFKKTQNKIILKRAAYV